MKKKDDKRRIAIKTSDQNEGIAGTNGLQILTFSLFFQTGKCPPRVETVAGKRQTWGTSGHVINLSNDGGGGGDDDDDDDDIFTHVCVSDIP